MEFNKFGSLENTYNTKVINNIMLSGITNWWVSEKIDGANFSIWVSNSETKIASRNQWVDDTFFGANVVINDVARKVEALFGSIDGAELLVVYGELFGHGIQNRVVYGPKQFNAFEVVVDGEVMPFFEMECMLNTFDIPMVPIIGIGFTFDEALSIEESFRSKLTPDGTLGENIGEGITIAPMVPTWIRNDSRVWLKKKTDAFSENKKSGKREKSDITLTDEENGVVESILEFVNENRVYSAISKHGQVTSKDFGKILGMVMGDLFEDFENETGQSVLGIKSTHDNWTKMSKTIQGAVTTTVRDVFVREL